MLLAWGMVTPVNLRPGQTSPSLAVKPGIDLPGWTAFALLLALLAIPARASESPASGRFRQQVQPILTKYCSDCHADGEKKGNVDFDAVSAENGATGDHALWLKVLKNVRAGLMPPQKKPRPSAEERKLLEGWIKYQAFAIDPKNPDPGRVTVRRLNRVEYRNTVRDLIGVDFNTEAEFPPDDTGYGFDNIGEVLTVSPMLLEKYLAAAKTIVAEAVPTVSGVPAEKSILGRSFHGNETNAPAVAPSSNGVPATSSLSLSYYQAASVSNRFHATHAGHYQVLLNLATAEKFVDNQFDYNKCRVAFKIDGEEMFQKEFVREGGKPFHFEFARDWKAGDHLLVFEITPLTPDQKQIRSLAVRINSVTIRGPMEEKYWVPPANYAKFFPKKAPRSPDARRQYAADLLRNFARKAFRGPVDESTARSLAALAEGVYTQPEKTFEAGVAHAMFAVLASPRFLFREERGEAVTTGSPSTAFVDPYALASRLSYFLWSSMPDDELLRLAANDTLRKKLPAQVKRMLADPRSEALAQNFTGQWLQTRDLDTVQIDARTVLARDDSTGGGNRNRGFGFRFNRPRAELDADLRKAMRRETELYIGNIMRADRSLTEVIESDYTFLNERLAKHYALTNLAVSGSELRRVTLPPGGPRGGILTQGAVLAVTSNPTRTSPVKRGLFILDNILGTPTPPPPPDIPPLEDAVKDSTNSAPSLRETLALHRAKPLCTSCHDRMDPLGLALENFNAMGMWREQELQQPIDAAGTLITGESFTNIQTLKHILATEHRTDFYRTVAEKLLTYALGRGLEYYDTQTVDQLVERLEKQDGRFSALLMGIVESAPFQKRRNPSTVAAGLPPAQSPIQTSSAR